MAHSLLHAPPLSSPFLSSHSSSATSTPPSLAPPRDPRAPSYSSAAHSLSPSKSLAPKRRVVAAVRGAASDPPAPGVYDPDLRLVLELATDSELFQLEHILFGPSYFSPLIKSIQTNKPEVDHAMIDKDLRERDYFIATLESRFFFLAADARSTLRGWRPSYRNVLLAVRKELKIPCSNKLSAQDLEAEIFLHMLQLYTSEELVASTSSSSSGRLESGITGWKVQALSSFKQFRLMFFKGGSIVTFAKIYQLLSSRLSGKVFVEGANYQIKRELIKKGGQLAAVNLESRAALLAAKQGFAGAASRYLGFRSVMSLLGPVLWGTLLADVVIQMLGTDYARIMRAVYALAQIRITRTYDLPSPLSKDEWGV